MCREGWHGRKIEARVAGGAQGGAPKARETPSTSKGSPMGQPPMRRLRTLVMIFLPSLESSRVPLLEPMSVTHTASGPASKRQCSRLTLWSSGKWM